MDQKELADSVAKQLDAVAETVYWATLLGVVFMWAGLTKQDPIEALGMKIGRSYALYVACGIYVATNLFATVIFLRIGDTLNLIDDQTFPVAVTKLATHKWLANPFSFFGEAPLANIYASSGFGLLIILWWIGNASLYSLSDDPFSLIGTFVQGVFLAIGLASMLAIQRVMPVVLRRIETLSPSLHAEVVATIPYRSAMTFAGIGVGALIAVAVNMSRFIF